MRQSDAFFLYKNANTMRKNAANATNTDKKMRKIADGRCHI